MSPPKRIPVAAVKRYAQEYCQDQVIILSFGPDGRTHVVTWGKDKKNCKEAAEGSERIMSFLGLEADR